ncbi:MAG: DUF2089 domain-containing protein [Gammaproteobacteria bacterium]|nr:DUF2089 domain-containing protein [Gammaproteobacteria bacterium]MDH3432908.1 DUF2089 domain-containing protein [Gammaproteobacteria bacterium]
MHQCLNCESNLAVAKLHCEACQVSYEGDFSLPRLARLSPPHQHLAEQLVLAAGNLKLMATSLEVSYPTLRKRLDELVEAVVRLRSDDDARTVELLKAVEAGEMLPETAARLIKELKGGL